ncbi:hypothetical protein DPEC_G00119160 [Dallia pectoralis]|uniref:Uncharacterized protein n=1 Tax=Dallia pectoralis TaxID=75939 RepID=A0ACC2GQ61_DALPE|nr:hypothetical protein DPEC_G00119160 [Dallia pectoralis]
MAALISPLRSSFRTCNGIPFHHVCCRAKLRMHRKCESQRRHLHASVGRRAAVVWSGTEMARQIHREIQREVEELVLGGNMRPHLGVVLVGDDSASRTYVRNKTRAASILGISSDTVVKPSSVSQEELLELIDKMNRDWKVSGVLVQLPLPGHINERAVCNAIAPEKDVDGFHIVNIGKLCLDQRSVVPATPAAVWEIIRRAGIETVGKNVLVAGRSKNVGLPIAMLLHTDRNHQRPGGDATVTIAHRCTPREQLKELTRLADIVIAAAGVPGLITADMVKDGAAVIDVGINRVRDPTTGKLRLVGDVDFNGVKEKAGLITPVPGGEIPSSSNIPRKTPQGSIPVLRESSLCLCMQPGLQDVRDKMSERNQTARAVTLFAVLLLLFITKTQSTEPSDNIQPTQLSTSAYTLPVNESDKETPRVLKMSKPCKEKDKSYCLNGLCMYPADSDTPACTCPEHYTGSRCGLMSHKTTSIFTQTEEVIGVCVGVALFLCCLAAIIYCCVKRRCQKLYLPYKAYGGSNTTV